jgi:hypothetical protein
VHALRSIFDAAHRIGSVLQQIQDDLQVPAMRNTNGIMHQARTEFFS